MSNYPRTSTVLRTFGLIKGSRWSEPRHARTGRYIHAGCALLAEGHEIDDDWFQRTSGTGSADTVDHADCIPKLNGYRKFLRHHPSFKLLAAEPELTHPVYGYVSHPDQICVLDKQLTLLELKSGMEQDYHDLQVASYLCQVLFHYGAFGLSFSAFKLYLEPDDYRLVPLPDPYRCIQDWIGLMLTWHRLVKYGSHLVRGQTE